MYIDDFIWLPDIEDKLMANVIVCVSSNLEIDAERMYTLSVGRRTRHRITLAPDLDTRLEAEVHNRGLLPEALVNLWVSERLKETDTELNASQAVTQGASDDDC